MAKHAAPQSDSSSSPVVLQPVIVRSAEDYLGRVRTTLSTAGRHAR